MFIFLWIAALAFWTYDVRDSPWLALAVLGWVALLAGYLAMDGRLGGRSVTRPMAHKPPKRRRGGRIK